MRRVRRRGALGCRVGRRYDATAGRGSRSCRPDRARRPRGRPSRRPRGSHRGRSPSASRSRAPPPRSRRRRPVRGRPRSVPPPAARSRARPWRRRRSPRARAPTSSSSRRPCTRCWSVREGRDKGCDRNAMEPRSGSSQGGRRASGAQPPQAHAPPQAQPLAACGRARTRYRARDERELPADAIAAARRTGEGGVDRGGHRAPVLEPVLARHAEVVVRGHRVSGYPEARTWRRVGPGLPVEGVHLPDAIDTDLGIGAAARSRPLRFVRGPARVG